ncbi:MAG: DUF4259 domain-containing protein [Bifidobacteriaceae bacterium]|jgi:hypothetical protein|nr:DUF4259 domain-containing protein [Bifidobacteriaceae bacterium]
MGAWGTGPFDNDGAADLVAEIRYDDFDLDNVAWAFEDPDHMVVDGGQIAIALGALIQAVNGLRPGPDDELDLADFKAQLTPERVAWVRAEMLRAMSDGAVSEAYDLWEDAGELEAWLEESRACLPPAAD